jgi:phosphoserine phosphatase
MSCAFFDVDGTLLEGFMIQSFPRFLADKGIVDSKYPNKIDEVALAYVSGRSSYRQAAEASLQTCRVFCVFPLRSLQMPS